jgi:N-acetylmuramoyl-L-alanine amidase
MPTGKAMVELAKQHIGQQYENVLVPKNNANWRGPWDCAEFMSWLVFQGAGMLYGCLNDQANPAVADAYTGSWRTDSANRGKRIPVNQAAATEGAFVLRFPPAAGRMGHIAICDGTGRTIEAKSHREGVVRDHVSGRRWDTGVLVPGVSYDEAGVIPVTGPGRVVRRGAANDPEVVRNIQRALDAAGIDSGGVDGKYGPKTAAAVAAFQRLRGLVVDGEVGPETSAELGVEI